jgi:hypothetical protein
MPNTVLISPCRKPTIPSKATTTIMTMSNQFIAHPSYLLFYHNITACLPIALCQLIIIEYRNDFAFHLMDLLLCEDLFTRDE